MTPAGPRRRHPPVAARARATSRRGRPLRRRRRRRRLAVGGLLPRRRDQHLGGLARLVARGAGRAGPDAGARSATPRWPRWRSRPSRVVPGPVRPAVGHGILDWMGQTGVRAASPMTLLREHTAAIRALLHGGRVTTGGPLRPPRRRRPGLAARRRAPLLVGARGDKTLALAGELADGVVLDDGDDEHRDLAGANSRAPSGSRSRPGRRARSRGSLRGGGVRRSRGSRPRRTGP